MNKVFDQCKSKECIRDLRVYLPTEDQCFIESNAVTVKPREAELLYVAIDVEKVPFKSVRQGYDMLQFFEFRSAGFL